MAAPETHERGGRREEGDTVPSMHALSSEQLLDIARLLDNLNGGEELTSGAVGVANGELAVVNESDDRIGTCYRTEDDSWWFEAWPDEVEGPA